jgi:sulfur-oxidizing protein SoxY
MNPTSTRTAAHTGPRAQRGGPRRRAVVGAGVGLAAGVPGLLLVPRPAAATPETMRAAIAAFTGGVAPKDGRVRLEIAELVENGNTVPVTVSVQSPMTEADHVRRLAIFNSMNPEPGVAVFHLSPRNGRARVATRMRLATTQPVLAVAHLSDGSFWQTSVDVVVTLAACVES